MEHHIVNNQHMEALEKLASTNMEISNAKNALFKMKEDESKYISEREIKTLDRIQKIFDDSEKILSKTKGNYAELNEFLTNVSELAKFVSETQGNLSGLFKDFEKRDVLWQAKVTAHESRLAEIEKSIKVQQVVIANEKKNIEKSWLLIGEEKKKIADKWAEIERELKRLKEK